MGTFTELLRGHELNDLPVAAIRPKLWRMLRHELSRRGLLKLPPAYLGYGNESSWNSLEVQNEALQDAFIYVFIDGRLSFARAAREERTIDPLIRIRVRQWLTVKQRMADPVGYATFANFRGACQQLVETKRLLVEQPRRSGGSPRGGAKVLPLMGNEVLRGSRVSARRRLTPTDILQTVASQAPWRTRVRDLGWISEPLQLVLAEWISECCVELGRFRWIDLVQTVKPWCRESWRVEELSSAAEPLLPVDSTDRVEFLLNCVERLLSSAEDDGAQASTPNPPTTAPQTRGRGRPAKFARAEFEHLLLLEIRSQWKATGEFPKQADVGRLLGIPKQRMSEIWDRLREHFRSCLENADF